MSVSKAQHEALQCRMRDATVVAIDAVLAAHSTHDRLLILRDVNRRIIRQAERERTKAQLKGDA